MLLLCVSTTWVGASAAGWSQVPSSVQGSDAEIDWDVYVERQACRDCRSCGRMMGLGTY